MDRTAPTINTADDVIDAGVAAVLLACSMLQRIGQRLAIERAFRLMRDTFDNRHVQIFSQYVASEGGRRWRVNKWA